MTAPGSETVTVSCRTAAYLQASILPSLSFPFPLFLTVATFRGDKNDVTSISLTYPILSSDLSSHSSLWGVFFSSLSLQVTSSNSYV